ncbi:MAG: indolepyruvate oxidoreductase subunit beta [Treponema sp.]|nr:indolepyruvate oxidoreductase subunit beta [Treponema sp.]
MSRNILICGVGGQGTVLAAKLIAQAAVSAGKKVLSAETIGMAQRGGSVVSHVRIGEDAFSPLIPKQQADIIISFEAAEAVRNLSFLKPNGMIIVNKKVVQPVTASLTGKTFSEDTMIQALNGCTPNVTCVDTDKGCTVLGSPKVVNTLLLGAACRTGIIEMKDIEQAIKLLVKPAFYDLNIQALHYGQQLA